MLCDQSYMCIVHTKHISLALALPIDSWRPSFVNILTSALICSTTNTICRQPLSACRGQAERREICDQFLLPSLHEVRLTLHASPRRASTIITARFIEQYLTLISSLAPRHISPIRPPIGLSRRRVVIQHCTETNSSQFRCVDFLGFLHTTFPARLV
jgi:hypothetical protein